MKSTEHLEEILTKTLKKYLQVFWKESLKQLRNKLRTWISCVLGWIFWWISWDDSEEIPLKIHEHNFANTLRNPVGKIIMKKFLHYSPENYLEEIPMQPNEQFCWKVALSLFQFNELLVSYLCHIGVLVDITEEFLNDLFWKFAEKYL